MSIEDNILVFSNKVKEDKVRDIEIFEIILQYITLLEKNLKCFEKIHTKLDEDSIMIESYTFISPNISSLNENFEDIDISIAYLENLYNFNINTPITKRHDRFPESLLAKVILYLDLHLFGVKDDVSNIKNKKENYNSILGESITENKINENLVLLNSNLDLAMLIVSLYKIIISNLENYDKIIQSIYNYDCDCCSCSCSSKTTNKSCIICKKYNKYKNKYKKLKNLIIIT